MDLACRDGFILPASSVHDAVEIKTKRLWIIPLVTDAHTHLGICRYAVRSSISNLWTIPFLSDAPTLSHLALGDRSFTIAAEAGIGTVVCDPGSTAVISGNGWIVDCHATGGRLVRQATLKCALGDTVVNYAYDIGRRVRREDLWIELYEGLSNLRLLENSTIRVHAYRWQDLHAAFMVGKDLSLQVIPLHAGEIVTAIDRGAEFNSVVLGPFGMIPTSDESSRRCSNSDIARLMSWGVNISIMTDAPVRHPSDLLRDIRDLISAGVPEHQALACISMNPRVQLGLPIGLMNGERAAFVAYNSSPADPESSPVLCVRGRYAWDTNDTFAMLRDDSAPVPLNVCDRSLFGGKSIGLQLATNWGYHVPDSEVLPLDLQYTQFTTSRPNIAVRSDAALEDGCQESRAGLYLSVLGVDSIESLFHAIHRVACTLVESDGNELRHSILIQDQVDALFAGCGMFSLDAEKKIIGVVEYSSGLADAMIGGLEDPRDQLFWSEGSGFSCVPSTLPNHFSTVMEVLLELVRTILQDREWIDKTGGDRGVDIEWACDNSGQLNVLQVRPLTTSVNFNLSTNPVSFATADFWSGTVIAPGVIRGKVAKTPNEATTGSILVTDHIAPQQMHRLHTISGLVTRTGGLTTHTGIVCRERGIPYISAVNNIQTLQNASEIVLDANRGVAYLPEQELPELNSANDTIWGFIPSDVMRRRLFSRPWREIRRQAEMYRGWNAFADHWPSQYFDPSKVEYAVADILVEGLTNMSRAQLVSRLEGLNNSEILAYLLPLVALGCIHRESLEVTFSIIHDCARVGRDLVELPYRSSFTAMETIEDKRRDLALSVLAWAGQLADLTCLGRHCHSQHIAFKDYDPNHFEVVICFNRGSSEAWLGADSFSLAVNSLTFRLMIDKGDLIAPLPYLSRKKYPFSLRRGLPQSVCDLAISRSGASLTSERELVQLQHELQSNFAEMLKRIQGMSRIDLEDAYARVLCNPLGLSHQVKVIDDDVHVNWPARIGLELAKGITDFKIDAA
jgi:phosphohistidine swiveling domain-containing protein